MLSTTPSSMRSERGAGSVELAVTAPLLLLLILASVQAALWAHAVHVTRAAASAAAEATRQYGETASAGKARAEQVINQLGHHLLLAPQVTATRSPTSARVIITAGVQPVIPGLRLHAHADVTAPAERFVPGQTP